MKTLVWSPGFKRAIKRVARRDQRIMIKVEKALRSLAENPFESSLRTHKLAGELAGHWACTVDYEYRIVFDFVSNPQTGEEEILLQNIGTHEEVY